MENKNYVETYTSQKNVFSLNPRKVAEIVSALDTFVGLANTGRAESAVLCGKGERLLVLAKVQDNGSSQKTECLAELVLGKETELPFLIKDCRYVTVNPKALYSIAEMYMKK